ncbi:anion exchange protein 3-like isoform X1 [Lates japonicus]|uniref:Anion exchange protein 3-like isoform X1 n=1 Tax=Lates japonicus TaxID=270547 RepID=A0AAD3QZ96_LATJO|nr:anion exchange protein 3-like isoform X1 [Lates japonicus]
MATGGHAPEIDVLINLQQVKVEEEDEEGSVEEQEEEEEEENWEKALSVERFGDIIGDSASTSGDRMGRHYTEKDFEYHRHTFHHTHHPLSTHLPLPQRLRKRVHSMDRRRKKKRKKKKTSLPPSDVTPTIHEVDEEEAESDTDGLGVVATPTELPDIQPQFSLGSQEDLEEPLPLTIFHMENEEHPLSKTAALTLIKGAAHNGGIDVLSHSDEVGGEEADFNSVPPGSDSSSSTMTRSWFRRKPVHHRLVGAQRSNYDLRERICIGSMTALETALYQQVPTDEAEAQMLASADLDDMKSHRFEDNPGVRRHLVKKSSRCQVTRTSNSSTPLCSLKKKKRAAEKKTHELFVELNELIVEKDHEMRWKERARWIKFEEDVEEDTDRWGKPHVASLSFRSLLELRRTITHGAILLDLEQNSLPGIAHLVVETMIISDQIRAEDRPSVLRALLLKHSHPSDFKHRFHRHHSSSSLHGSFNHNHIPDTNLPLVAEEQDEHQDNKGPVYDPKQDVFVSLFKSLHPLPPESHPAAARSMKLRQDSQRC